MTKFLCILPVIVALWFPMDAFATSCNGIGAVTVTATGVAFGNYSAAAASDTTASGTISVGCTITLGNPTIPSFTIALSAGIAGTFAPRHMSYLTNNLNYNLYTASNHSSVWGDGTGSTVTQSYNASAGLTSINYTVYGDLPKGQFVSAGLYSDLITVTVTY